MVCPFKAWRGVTQDGPFSPTLFNLMMYAINSEWDRLLLLKGVPVDDICAFRAIFYADDGLIVARNPKHLQMAIDLLTGLFGRVDLQTNTQKTEVMTFLPGKIRTSLSGTAHQAQMDATFSGKHRGLRVECGECGTLLAAGLLASHQATQHDTYKSFVPEEEEEDASRSPKHWDAVFFAQEGCYRCPVLDCPQGREDHGVRNSWNMQ